MALAKSGNWWQTHPHRSLANNSAVYEEKPSLSQFMDEWKAMAMEYAKINLPVYKPHDAGWDSARHLLCFDYFKTAV